MEYLKLLRFPARTPAARPNMEYLKLSPPRPNSEPQCGVSQAVPPVAGLSYGAGVVAGLSQGAGVDAGLSQGAGVVAGLYI